MQSMQPMQLMQEVHEIVNESNMEVAREHNEEIEAKLDQRKRKALSVEHMLTQGTGYLAAKP